jgi:hypothetical protein
MNKEQLIEILTMHIMQYEYDLKYEPKLMAKKRTNADIAKQCIKNYENVVKALEDLE